MPTYGYLPVPLHARTDHPVQVGHIDAGNKDPLLRLDLALRTDDNDITSESAQGKAFQFDGRALASPNQSGNILRNGNVDYDLRSLHNLRKSISVDEAPTDEVLHERCGHHSIKRSSNCHPIQPLAGAYQFRFQVLDFHPLG